MIYCCVDSRPLRRLPSCRRSRMSFRTWVLDIVLPECLSPSRCASSANQARGRIAVCTPAPRNFWTPALRALEPLLYAELEKCKRFEVITVSPEDLRRWTGKSNWRADEPLPPDFFARVSDGTGCDAVLFCQLTRCQPYQPVAVGWKFGLVINPPPGPLSAQEMKDKILWCADEVLDAGEPGVSNAARDYYGQHLRNEQASADSSTILNSPARFGQYTLASLFATLPERTGPLNSAKDLRNDGPTIITGWEQCEIGAN